MQVTRQQIIDYLNKNHVATAAELSRVLNVTAANIRHHIAELINQEIIEEVGHIPPLGRGRPKKLFCLSKGALNHNLDFLATILLQTIRENRPEKEFDQRYEDIANRMVENTSPPSNLLQRLTQAIEWLTAHNYQARWEASPTGPRIILGYCPYVAILDTNPEMCQIDAKLVTQLTGMPVEQRTRLERTSRGNHQCVFASRQR